MTDPAMKNMVFLYLPAGPQCVPTQKFLGLVSLVGIGEVLLCLQGSVVTAGSIQAYYSLLTSVTQFNSTAPQIRGCYFLQVLIRELDVLTSEWMGPVPHS